MQYRLSRGFVIGFLVAALGLGLALGLISTPHRAATAQEPTPSVAEMQATITNLEREVEYLNQDIDDLYNQIDDLDEGGDTLPPVYDGDPNRFPKKLDPDFIFGM